VVDEAEEVREGGVGDAVGCPRAVVVHFGYASGDYARQSRSRCIHSKVRGEYRDFWTTYRPHCRQWCARGGLMASHFLHHLPRPKFPAAVLPSNPCSPRSALAMLFGNFPGSTVQALA
jgi:hypothetical protein